MKGYFFILSVLIVLSGCLQRQSPDVLLKNQLSELGFQKIESVSGDSLFQVRYQCFLEQPLDHFSDSSKTFQQRLTISHVGYQRPVVLITEGYAMRANHLLELAKKLNANQVRVEYRYFGQSTPDSLDWSFLTIEQSSVDYHRIREVLGKIYKGPWLVAGWSKGGQTALVYYSYFPQDVKAVMAYDAPLNHSIADPRIDAFFEKVGTPECRQRLIQFQRTVLRRRSEILPRFHWYALGKGYRFSIGEEKALEYIVLEYPFSFWQYHHIDCQQIPGPQASADQLLEHLRRVVSFSSYSDRALNSPAMYQFMTQLGYYQYVQKNVQDLLKFSDHPNAAFAPQRVSLTFDPRPMQRLEKWLEQNGNHIIYLYGQNDPWSATGVVPAPGTDARRFVLPGGNHYTFISTFPRSVQKQIVTLLKQWLYQ